MGQSRLWWWWRYKHICVHSRWVLRTNVPDAVEEVAKRFGQVLIPWYHLHRPSTPIFLPLGSDCHVCVRACVQLCATRFVCVCVRECAFLRSCVRACVRACARVCLCVCVCVIVCVYACVRARTQPYACLYECLSRPHVSIAFIFY